MHSVRSHTSYTALCLRGAQLPLCGENIGGDTYEKGPVTRGSSRSRTGRQRKGAGHNLQKPRIGARAHTTSTHTHNSLKT